jgi:hypothetical protein
MEIELDACMMIALFGGVGLFIPKDVHVVMREREEERGSENIR